MICACLRTSAEAFHDVPAEGAALGVVVHETDVADGEGEAEGIPGLALPFDAG